MLSASLLAKVIVNALYIINCTCNIILKSLARWLCFIMQILLVNLTPTNAILSCLETYGWCKANIAWYVICWCKKRKQQKKIIKASLHLDLKVMPIESKMKIPRTVNWMLQALESGLCWFFSFFLTALSRSGIYSHKWKKTDRNFSFSANSNFHKSVSVNSTSCQNESTDRGRSKVIILYIAHPSASLPSEVRIQFCFFLFFYLELSQRLG